MAESEIADFLTDLAMNKQVVASTKNQALNALVFLYQHVLHESLQEIHDIALAKKKQKRPNYNVP